LVQNNPFIVRSQLHQKLFFGNLKPIFANHLHQTDEY